MSARNRGRATANQDADEERRLWKEIRDKARDVDTMVARSNEVGRDIVEYEGQQAALKEANKPLSGDLDEKLEKLYRENLKLAEDVQHIIEGKSHDTHLLDSIKILAAMREASEEAMAAISQHQASQNLSSRAANGKSKRAPPKGGGGGKNGAVPAPAIPTPVAASLEEGEVESAAPSPRISLGVNASRLPGKDKSSRAGSIPATRETSVKIEDGAESVASSADGANSTATGKLSSAGGRNTTRLVLRQGEVVFCRHDPKNYDAKKVEQPEGEGILCRVTAVIGEGKQRRYEVQDEEDPTGEPPKPQRASVSQLIQIPESNKGLSDLGHKRKVLAQYPDTTTFYKAEVAEEWLVKKAHVGGRGQYVKLNFQDDVTVREVERRFVLTEK
nr:saga-associated factor 29 [Quercus suber]